MDQKLNARKNGHPEYIGLKFLKSDAEPLWVNAACGPLLNEDDLYVGMLSLMMDITERKKNRFSG